MELATHKVNWTIVVDGALNAVKRSQNQFFYTVGLSAPEVENTKVTMFNILDSMFIRPSLVVHDIERGCIDIRFENGLNTLMSKKAFCSFMH